MHTCMCVPMYVSTYVSMYVCMHSVVPFGALEDHDVSTFRPHCIPQH